VWTPRLLASFVLSLVVIVGCFWIIISRQPAEVSDGALTVVAVVITSWVNTGWQYWLSRVVDRDER
jgi:hypothetical protein